MTLNIIKQNHNVIFFYFRRSVEELRFRAGSSIREEGGTLHPVEQMIAHPQYDRLEFDDDIAVVKVCIRSENI